MHRIMGCIDSNEAIAEALECLQLERSLDTEYKHPWIQF